MNSTPPGLDDLKEIECEVTRDIYKISIIGTENELLMKVIKEGSFPRKIYQAKHTLESLLKISKWFKLFENVIESAIELNIIFQSQKFNIEDGSNLKIIVDKEINVKEKTICFVLEKIPISNEELIEELGYRVNQLCEAVVKINKRIDVIENNQNEQKLKRKEDNKLIQENNIANKEICKPEEKLCMKDIKCVKDIFY